MTGAEWPLMLAALAAYAGALVAGWNRAGYGRRSLQCLTAGLVLHAGAIGVRWEAVGHGPYVTLFEVLSGNIWSLLLIFLLASLLARTVRIAAPIVLGVTAVMAVWMLMEPASAVSAPATFDTPILWVHLVLGKVFLGLSLVAAGLGGVILVRHAGLRTPAWQAGADERELEKLAYRCLGIGLAFETAMLVAGAAFAQEAWGRFWGWDTLETMSLLTWTTAVLVLHYRATRRPGPVLAASLPWLVFALAFFTLFGVPFLSDAPHQGTFGMGVGGP